jgi:hypothetical protein
MEEKIAQAIATYYKIPSLEPEHHIFATSTEVFQALENGTIDMTESWFSIGGFDDSSVGVVRRRTFFRRSCTVQATETMAITL